MYAIKLKEGVYHKVLGWVTEQSVPLSQATLYTSASQAEQVIKLHKLRLSGVPQIVRVSR